MELKLLLTLLRRWAWLLVLGAILGTAGGYLASYYQEPLYQATTKVMVIKPQQSSVTADVTLNDQELTQTYIALLTTDPVLDATSERLGFAISENQVSARQTSGTRLLEVTARASEPERTALIANTLVDVLIEQNNALQSNRFAASEESLQAQITQVEAQINQLQDGNRTAADAQAEREALEGQIASLRTDVLNLQQEVEELTSPSLTAAEQERLLEKQIELAQLRFNLSSEQTAYNARLSQNPNARNSDTEARILALREQELRLEQEMEDLRSQAVGSDPEARSLLVEKQAELAQKQFDLDLAKRRYLSLLSSNQAVGSSENAGSQGQLQTTLSLYQQLYSNLLSTYESVRLARLQNTPDLVQVERATAPGAPIQPQPLQDTLLGAAVGLIIMGAVAFVIEYLDDTLKSPVDINRVLQRPVIGFIADTKEMDEAEKGTIVFKHPRSPVAEAFRTLRTNLEFAGVERPLRTILITSPGPADGKTTVATNLAESMAHNGKQVVLVDADLRRPRIHRILGVSNRFGLSDAFRDQLDVVGTVQSWPEMENLAVITSGGLPPNPAELLGSGRMDEILSDLKQRADVVVIDSPPFVVSDPSLLAAKVDGVVLVMQPGETSVDAAQAMFAQLQRADANVIGVVLNRVPRKRGYYGGYHFYYAPYYYSSRYYMDGSTNGRSGTSRQTNLFGSFLNRFRNERT